MTHLLVFIQTDISRYTVDFCRAKYEKRLQWAVCVPVTFQQFYCSQKRFKLLSSTYIVDASFVIRQYSLLQYIFKAKQLRANHKMVWQIYLFQDLQPNATFVLLLYSCVGSSHTGRKAYLDKEASVVEMEYY